MWVRKLLMSNCSELSSPYRGISSKRILLPNTATRFCPKCSIRHHPPRNVRLMLVWFIFTFLICFTNIEYFAIIPNCLGNRFVGLSFVWPAGGHRKAHTSTISCWKHTWSLVADTRQSKTTMQISGLSMITHTAMDKKVATSYRIMRIFDSTILAVYPRMYWSSSTAMPISYSQRSELTINTIEVVRAIENDLYDYDIHVYI